MKAKLSKINNFVKQWWGIGLIILYATMILLTIVLCYA
jgi:hypothetical protein